ncbi:MAG: hypothetical protein D6737_00720 [Chloroflexi bacterium]|nr:MAG: hypothetical protein CUN54_04510 [Phototrophicales bacterium]RMF82785.1 MAG: hypothetical protein D6737_00720 [Chloroflexota bacterium]
MRKPSKLIKPSLETQFHIDYTWWERSQEDLSIYLLSHLPPEQRDQLSGYDSSKLIDYVDPETGEVHQLDNLGYAIRMIIQNSEFINEHTALVDAIFRVFLVNGNKPLTPNELGEYLGKPASTILKTLSGGRVYKGLRPVK